MFNKFKIVLKTFTHSTTAGIDSKSGGKHLIMLI
jgi:hypothetical protein